MRPAHLIRVLVLGWLALAAVEQLEGCGPTAQQKALRTGLDGLNAARDGFLTWDKAHQEQILAQAPDRVTAQAALNAYRLQRVSVESAFVVGYQALALAAAELQQPSIDVALKAVQDTLAAIAALKQPVDAVTGAGP